MCESVDLFKGQNGAKGVVMKELEERGARTFGVFFWVATDTFYWFTLQCILPFPPPLLLKCQQKKLDSWCGWIKITTTMRHMKVKARRIA